MELSVYNPTHIHLPDPAPDATRPHQYGQPVMVLGVHPGDPSKLCPARVWFNSQSAGRVWLVAWWPQFEGGRPVAFPFISHSKDVLEVKTNGATPPKMPSWAAPVYR